MSYKIASFDRLKWSNCTHYSTITRSDDVTKALLIGDNTLIVVITVQKITHHKICTLIIT